MNDYAHDIKRDVSLEDQSRLAAHDAKHAASRADFMKDLAAIAEAEFTKTKAESDHNAALRDAEQKYEQAGVDKAYLAEQLKGAQDNSLHLHKALIDTRIKVQNATAHRDRLKHALDQAEKDTAAALDDSKTKSTDYEAAHKIESDLRAQFSDLDAAPKTFEMAKCKAEVALATANLDYFNTIALIRKTAADRHKP